MIKIWSNEKKWQREYTRKIEEPARLAYITAQFVVI